MNENYKTLFEPVSIGTLTIKNRFAMAPMGPLGLGDADGGFNQRGIEYYTERAKGGTGLIVTGVTFPDTDVEEHSCPGVPSPTRNEHQFVRSSREMTERIHAYGSKVLLMMSGGFGRVSIPEDRAPSIRLRLRRYSTAGWIKRAAQSAWTKSIPLSDSLGLAQRSPNGQALTALWSMRSTRGI